MPRQLIAIDLDDVLSSQVDVLIDFFATQYNIHITTDHFKKPGEYWTYFQNIPGVDPDVCNKIFQEFLDTERPLQQVVSAEAIAVIRRLQKKGYDFEIITARGARWQKGTERWLEKHLPRTVKNIHFVELWNRGDKKATKAMICNEIGAGYLIDDNVEHCNLADEAGVQAILFGEWGWNMYQPVRPGVIRLPDWLSVERFFNEQG